MATTIILPPAAALEAAAAELIASADTKRHATLNKGLYDLLVLEPQIIAIAGAFLVPSSSRGGIIHRVDHVAGCSCEAGRAGRQCRHAAAIEIIEQAQTRAMPRLTPAYDKALAEINELF